jgi:2,3-bisphosphoglycerate-independent phosphoglycerate mutase
LTQYDAKMPGVVVAYKPQSLDHVFGQIVAERGMKQLRIAEVHQVPRT